MDVETSLFFIYRDLNRTISASINVFATTINLNLKVQEQKQKLITRLCLIYIIIYSILNRTHEKFVATKAKQGHKNVAFKQVQRYYLKSSLCPCGNLPCLGWVFCSFFPCTGKHQAEILKLLLNH